MTAWRGVRFRADVGWEMRCDSCAAANIARYWPLTEEFWVPAKGLSRCRACWNAYQQRRVRQARQNRVRSAEIRAYQREWAARKREQMRQDQGRRRYERAKKAA